MTVKKGWRKILAVVFWLGVLSWYGYSTQQSGLGPLQVAQKAGAFLNGSAWGPAIYVGLYTVRPLFLFSAALLTLAGGAVFGPLWGTVYTLLGSNLGASLAYLLGRLLGSDIAEVEDSEKGLGRHLRGMREKSFETVFLLRLMFVPYDLVNYAAGFLKIRFSPFIIATALGSLPGTLSFVLFGASSGLDKGAPAFDPRILLASVVIFLASLALSRQLKTREVSIHEPL
jgi:uncharacterized membrane protein YdjX (TVP38/TMEM64 family)